MFITIVQLVLAGVLAAEKNLQNRASKSNTV